MSCMDRGDRREVVKLLLDTYAFVWLALQHQRLFSAGFARHFFWRCLSNQSAIVGMSLARSGQP
jgi:hypothetical protein